MTTFIFILVIHWVGDAVFQAEEWATQKSNSFKALLKHTSMYSLIWLIPTAMITRDALGTALFILITFLFHTITDYFTSKAVSRKFGKGELGSPIPNFGAFSLILFDQLLHYFQLIITWKFIFGFTC